MWNRIRDWWRGYSDADVKSVQDKMNAKRGPGEVIPFNYREWKAYLSLFGHEAVFFDDAA